MTTFEDRKDLSKFEKVFLNELLNDIEKREKSTWTKPWEFIESQNAFTGHKYSGLNAMHLELISRIYKFEDTRFSTFNQAKKNDYYVKKGSTGIPIQFFSFINKETKKEWNEKEFQEKSKNMSPSEKRKELDKKVVISKTFHVFNAKNLISNKNKLSFTENNPLPRFNKKLNTNDLINKFEQNLINSMNINYEERHSKGAYYTPQTDTVTMPLLEQFSSYEDRQATLLHELGHGTGHIDRLNRTFGKTFGDKEYSLEEMKVELNSVFMTNTLGLNISENQRENHLKYLDSWGSKIKDNPKEFLNVLKDGLKIKDYMLEKGNFKELFIEDNLEFNLSNESLIEEKEYKDLIDFQLSHYAKVNEVIYGTDREIEYISDIDSPSVQKFSSYSELWSTHFRNELLNDIENLTLSEIKNNAAFSKSPDLLERLIKIDKDIETRFNKSKSFESSLKEVDLDNDGVPSRIDPDDNRSVIKTEADKSLVGNKTDKYQQTQNTSIGRSR